MPEKYRGRALQILTRFGSPIERQRVDIAPLLHDALLRISLDQVQVVGRNDQFSLFIPQHHKAAGRLIRIFMGLRNANDLMAFAAFSRDRVNPHLYVYAFSTALLHRDDTKNIRLPTYSNIFPERFIDCESIVEAREMAEIMPNPSDRTPIEIPRDFTGNDLDPEHRLAYFREDLGVNLHHWHWHLIYPFDGPETIVNKDRRGELFYYLHHQIIARYNIERLCNNMNLVHRLIDWDEPIVEGYFPMLNTVVAGKTWPGRPANMRMSNINRPDMQMRFDIDDMRRYRDRIHEAIQRKRVFSRDGSEIDIDNDRGIDVLGNIIEASILTPNPDYYGSIHNFGHIALAFIHDPQYRYMQTTGVMLETTTAMRDPVFYRWHAFIDDLFNQHKTTLPPYDENNLNFPGIRVAGIEICSYDMEPANRDEINVIRTFFMKSDVNLSRGMDFAPRGAVLARITHLNHERFAYHITVINTVKRRVTGTVRIFMAPIFGFGNFAIDLTEQRRLMVEMDRFVVALKPGENKIVRQSNQSSVTIPYEQTFRNLDVNRPDVNDYEQFARFNYCGCGWPQHMLVPKGNTSGYPMILFAMISDYEKDKVVSRGGNNGTPDCRTGVTFCGLRDKLFPDKRPMGYPFDRPLRPNANTLDTFVTPNMAFTNITIRHSNEVREHNLAYDNTTNVRDLPSDSGNTAELG